MAFSETDMINGYTRDELFDLSNDDLRLVTEQGWQRGPNGKPVSPEEFSRSTAGAFGMDKQVFRGQELKFDTGAHLPSRQAPSQDPYAPTAWGGETEYDFVTPSGQRCRLRQPDPAKMLEDGLLHRVSRLQGIVQQNIDAVEGKPPNTLDFLKDPEKAKGISEVIDSFVIHLVVAPRIYPVPADGNREAGRVYIDSVNFLDRVAITEQGMSGVTKLDNFRK